MPHELYNALTEPLLGQLHDKVIELVDDISASAEWETATPEERQRLFRLRSYVDINLQGL